MAHTKKKVISQSVFGMHYTFFLTN